MIDKIEVSGSGYKVEEPLRKYVKKRIGKLDRYLPRHTKKDVVCKVIISGIGKGKNDKYEVSAAMEIPGGKVLAARDECSNEFAGVDLIEAKLMGQIRRYKVEMKPAHPQRSLKNLFMRRK